METLKKYGVWIAAGALVLYLVYRNARGAPRLPQSLPGGVSSEQYRLESERLRQAGAFDLERLKLDASRDAAQRKLDLDRFSLEQQVRARDRLLDTQQRQQTLGLIGQLANALANLFKGQQQPKGGAGGGPSIGTPPTFPNRVQLPPAPNYPVPEPNLGASIFNSPTYVPDWPAPPTEFPLSITDWGEAPLFEDAGMGLDSGATFYDQFAGVSYVDAYDPYYGSSGAGYYGAVYGDYPSYDLWSSDPQLGPDYGPDAGTPADQYHYGSEDYYYGFSGDYSYGDYNTESNYADYYEDYGGDY